MRRIWNVVLAIFGAGVSRAERAATSELLDKSHEDLLNMLTAAERDLADVASAKHRILQLVGDAKQESAKLETQASEFLSQGNESMAVQALERKALVSQRLSSFEAKLADADDRQLALEGTVKELQNQIDNFGAEKELLKAEHSAARAQARIGKQVTGIARSANNVGRTISRVREDTRELEAEAAGVAELVRSGTLRNQLDPGKSSYDREAEAIQRQTSVAADLERLKRQLPAGEKVPAS